MDESADRSIEPRRSGWLFPLGCLALCGLCANIDVFTYPQHFEDHCARFGEHYPKLSVSELIAINAAWCLPAAFLLVLRRSFIAVAVHSVICFLVLLVVWTFLSEDFRGEVNCYKDIGLGEAMIGLVLVLQAAILLALSCIVLLVPFASRLLSARRDERSAAP